MLGATYFLYRFALWVWPRFRRGTTERNRDLLSEDRLWSSMALLARCVRSSCTVSYSKSIVGAAFMAMSSVRRRPTVGPLREAGRSDT